MILAFGGDGDPLPGWSLGRLQTAFSAIESMRRQVASELGATLRTSRRPIELAH